jgi:hypothetical protein
MIRLAIISLARSSPESIAPSCFVRWQTQGRFERAAARWRGVNYSRHESSARRYDIGSPRSRLAVRSFTLPFQIYPIEQPAR